MSFSKALASTTPLSGPEPAGARRCGFFALARASLLAVAVAMLPGCLVEDPPEYRAPTRTPPRLNLTRALPSPDQIRITRRGSTIPFEIPVSSEDDGVGLAGFLLVDYDGVSRWSQWGGAELPPSTLDDGDRKLQFNPTVDATNDFADEDELLGCHRVTLRVTHRDNFILGTIPLVVDPADVAEAYWYLNVIGSSPTEDPSVLRNCPQASAESP
jgi:hypothetical protein